MSYNQLRNEVIQKSNTYPIQNLTYIKNIFAGKINSVRRLDNILNVADLLNILEKRNEHDLECLVQILSILNLPGLIPQDIDNNRNENTPRDENRERHITKCAQIYDIICNELGIKWKEFARGLGLTQAKIEELEDANRLISERLRVILTDYENQILNKKWDWVPILNALARCRRNDLRLKISQIINN